MRAETLDDRIGMLFQQNALFDSLSVWENIGFRLMARGSTRWRVPAPRNFCPSGSAN